MTQSDFVQYMFSRAIARYSESVKEEAFAKYEKELAERINQELCNALASNMREEDVVESLEKLINAFGAVSQTKGDLFTIVPKTVFIHGYPKRSGVEFSRYGKEEMCELGDLVFILSVIFRDLKYFEKVSICQFKKEGKRGTTWKIEEKQLFLLSRFPTFKGVKGSIVPAKRINLANYSECLGSYGLFYRPGEFAFVSAKWLSHYMGNAKSIDGKDIFALFRYLDGFRYHPSVFFNNWHMCVWCGHPAIVLRNDLFAFNVYDFVDRYLHGNIGEYVFSVVGDYDPAVRCFLWELMNGLKQWADEEDNGKMKALVENYFRYKFVTEVRKQSDDDNEWRNGHIEPNTAESSGGLGVVHVTIELKGE
jgi:hypothetical protein